MTEQNNTIPEDNGSTTEHKKRYPMVTRNGECAADLFLRSIRSKNPDTNKTLLQAFCAQVIAAVVLVSGVAFYSASKGEKTDVKPVKEKKVEHKTDTTTNAVVISPEAMKVNTPSVD